jgi:FlaA1/EpsC-like NDP-sugar epimerase
VPHYRSAVIFLGIALPIKLAIFARAGLYRRLWRHAGIGELQEILWGSAISGVVCFLLGALVLPTLGVISIRIPLSVLVIDAFLTAGAVSSPRLFIRIFGRRPRHRRRKDARRALIVGAGSAGEIIVKELVGHPQLGLEPMGFVDDDRLKHGHRLCDRPVLGSLAEIPEVVDAYDIEELVIAMPRASGQVVRRVVRAAEQAGVRTRTVPGIFDILSGRVAVGSLREVQIEDLLRRDPITTDLNQVRSLASGETVLVTGAGGSIGSELCRQLARLDPASILLLGHGENSIFEILEELKRLFPRISYVPLIADVRDRQRLSEVFSRYKPFAVFHAAAHKHVPLMECNVAEAVTNNIMGTQNVAELAGDHEVEHFVLISTDKAVRPTNIMGATKRVAEQIVQHIADITGRNFVAVRFGNVLGSRGSVVPTFLQQIKAGGPVTVTHPEMRRFFMTIPESVQLVLQAGALGKGGEVFVLDMGAAVKIVDLATDLVRLSGLEVGTDIEIRFTGARPGERLYEELFFDSESATHTGHPKVLKATNAPLAVGFSEVVDKLVGAAQQGHPNSELVTLLERLVPDFSLHATPQSEPILDSSARVLAG